MRLCVALLLIPVCAYGASSKIAVIGSQHDLTAAGTGPVKSAAIDACIICHAPHNITPNVTPLWDHKLSVQTYTTYTSSTYVSGTQTPSAGSSKLCLSCHDGTVAVGLTVAQGTITTTGSMTPGDVFGANLATSHPVSMTPVDNGQLFSGLFGSSPASKDPTVLLVSGKVECTTCHDPHVQNKDAVAKNFLVRSNAAGALCTASHDSTRPQPNILNGWTSGAHATVTSTVPTTAGFGAYGTVAANACSNCHGAHQNGTGPRDLRAKEEANCSPCHSGANVSPAPLNVMAEFSKTYSHPTLTVTGAHDAAETLPVNSTRHAECEDCHNDHAAQAQPGFPLPPALPLSLTGVSGYDTTGSQVPATKEYQVCLKCHADSTNKPTTSSYGRTAGRYLEGPLPATYTAPPPTPPDQYNLRLKFTSTIGHNVMGNSVANTGNSSLRPYVTDINGANITSRPLTKTSLIYCTDCHNNNASRTISSTGPDGPHGSTFPHLLQFTLYQETLGGSSGNSNAASAMCNKCHNLTTVANISPHDNHRSYGCTTCHDPHGVIGGNSSANHAMINFDTGVVSRATTYYGYFNTGATRGCYLVCHGDNHNPRTY